MRFNRPKFFFYYLIILLVAFGLYANTLTHDYNFDDEFVVLNPQVQQGFDGIIEIFSSRYFSSEDQTYGYRPIAKSTFAIEYTIFNQNASVSHFINVLLYAFTGMFMFYFLVKHFQYFSAFAAIIIVLLFIAHPLHTEVVSSLKNREEILSFLFGLAGVHGVLTFINKSKFWWLLAAFLMFVLSILSKESGVLFLGLGLLLGAVKILENTKRLQLPQLVFPATNKVFTRYHFTIGLAVLLFGLLVVSYFLDFKFWVEFSIHFPLTLLTLVIIPLQIFYKKTIVFTEKKYLFFWMLFSAATPFHYEVLGPVIYGVIAFYFGGRFLIQFLQRNFKTLQKSTIQLISLLFVVVGVFGFSAAVFYVAYILPNEALSDLKIKLTIQQTPLLYINDVFAPIKLAAEVILFYIKQLIYPAQMLFYYGYNMVQIPENFTLNTWIGIFTLLVLVLITIFSYPKKHLFVFMYFITAGLIFFSNLIFEIPGIVGDRLMYVSSFGFCGLIGWFIFKLHESKWPIAKVLAKSVFVVVFLLFGIKTIARNADWKNKYTLYTADIEHMDASARGNMIYADFLFSDAKLNGSLNQSQQKDMLQASAYYYQKSLSVDSTNFTALNNLSAIYFNYLQNTPKAKFYLRKAIKTQFVNYHAYNNLGTIYENTRPDSAVYFYNKSLQLKPQNPEAMLGKGIVYMNHNMPDSAYLQFAKIISNQPSFMEAHINMAMFLLQQNDTANAIRFYENALKINPQHTFALQQINQLTSIK